MDSLNKSGSIETVQATFDEWASAGRGDRMEEGHWPTSKQLLEQLEIQPNHWFLDIGCGNGYAVRWASQAVGPQGKAIGTDLSPGMIELALKKTAASNTQYRVANVEALPFGDNTFDRILNIESLYYYPNLPKALTEIYRVLKPGGWFAAMVDFYQENPYGHIWPTLIAIPMILHSEKEYQGLFETAGFHSVKTQRLFNPAPVDRGTFQPGWGYDTPEDVLDFRQNIGSLGIVGEK